MCKARKAYFQWQLDLWLALEFKVKKPEARARIQEKILACEYELLMS